MTIVRVVIGTLLVALVTLVGVGRAQVIDKKVLTLAAAKQVIAAAVAEAKAKDAPGGAIAVVDGSAIRGGGSRRLAKGDVIVIPNEVPHWFQDVQGPFLYYVVKVR